MPATLIEGTQIRAGTLTDTQMTAANKDGLGTVPSMRTLGTGAQQAAAGNDSRFLPAYSGVVSIGAGTTSTTFTNGSSGTGAVVLATSATLTSPTFSGTVTLGGMTAGSILFAGTGGVLSQDNANLYWDLTNFRLGIGTNAPTVPLHVILTASSQFQMVFKNAYNTPGTGGGATLQFDNGVDTSSLGIAQPNRTADGALTAGSTVLYSSNAAGIVLMSDNANATIRFATGGSTERVRIDGSGNVGIGTASPSYPIDILANSLTAAQLRCKNTYSTAGTAAAGIAFDNGTDSSNLGIQQANRSAYGPMTAGTTTLYTSNAAGICLMADAGGVIKFAAGSSTERMRLDATGALSVFTTTDTTSPTTGSVILSGGMGVAKSIQVGGNLTVGNLLINGQRFQVLALSELLTIAAAASTSTIVQIPTNAVVLGVSVRVIVVIPTAATFTVTGNTSSTVFNTAAVSTAVNSTDPGTKAGAFYNAAAQTVRITPNLTPSTATGQVRITIHYYQITPPTN
jgi:hypothetical protein